MAARNFLPRCIALESGIVNESIGIRLQNAMHLGKKFLAAIFSVIVYCIGQDSSSSLRPCLGQSHTWPPINSHVAAKKAMDEIPVLNSISSSVSVPQNNL